MLPPTKCPSCGLFLPPEDFGRSCSRSTGLQWTCKKCTNARKREWAQRNRSQLHANQRKWKYGISPEEYDELLLKADGHCMGCKLPSGKLVIDHDHSTGQVRGLLCHPCNKALGFARDSARVLRSLAEHLEAS